MGIEASACAQLLLCFLLLVCPLRVETQRLYFFVWTTLHNNCTLADDTCWIDGLFVTPGHRLMRVMHSASLAALKRIGPYVSWLPVICSFAINRPLDDKLQRVVLCALYGRTLKFAACSFPHCRALRNSTFYKWSHLQCYPRDLWWCLRSTVHASVSCCART